jgi:hypothetical protein
MVCVREFVEGEVWHAASFAFEDAGRGRCP